MRAIFILPIVLFYACSVPKNNPVATDTVAVSPVISGADSSEPAHANETMLAELLNRKVRVLQADTNPQCIVLQFEKGSLLIQSILTDSFPSTLVPHVTIDTIQMNDAGSKDLIVQISALHDEGGWGQYITSTESYGCYFVYDLDNERKLFHGVSSDYYLHICPETDSGCAPVEMGYYYPVAFYPGIIEINGAQIYGDSADTHIDHGPGLYEWKNGAFVRMFREK